jgi:hypothetical protein
VPGRLRRRRVFTSREEALEAAGLSEWFNGHGFARFWGRIGAPGADWPGGVPGLVAPDGS